jgi:hypothetical protein
MTDGREDDVVGLTATTTFTEAFIDETRRKKAPPKVSSCREP